MEKEKDVRVDRVSVFAEIDTDAETSWIGEYADDGCDWAICRCCGEYLAEVDDDHEVPQRGREYRFFVPYAGGEEPGTDNYKVYGKQDYNRAEALNRGDWYLIGITARAEV